MLRCALTPTFICLHPQAELCLSRIRTTLIQEKWQLPPSPHPPEDAVAQLAQGSQGGVCPLSERCPCTDRSNHWCCGFLSIPVHLRRHQEPQTCFPGELWAGPHISSCLVRSLVPAMWVGTLRQGSTLCRNAECWGMGRCCTTFMRSSPR